MPYKDPVVAKAKARERQARYRERQALLNPVPPRHTTTPEEAKATGDAGRVWWRSYAAAWRAANPEKVKAHQETRKAKMAALRASNPEIVKAHQERNKAKQAALRASNPEIVKAHQERNKAKQAAWRAANPEADRERKDKRNAKLRAAGRKFDRRYYKAPQLRVGYGRAKRFQDAVKLYYGCSNPGCLWDGDLPPCAYDFHHLDDEGKEECVSQLTGNKAALIREINRCCVLCANCHRMTTWGGLDTSDCQPCRITPDGKVIGPV